MVKVKTKPLMELKLRRGKLCTLDYRVVDAVWVGRPRIVTVFGPEANEYVEYPTRRRDWAGQRIDRVEIDEDKIEERIENLILREFCPEGSNAYLAGKLKSIYDGDFYHNWGKAVQYYKINNCDKNGRNNR